MREHRFKYVGFLILLLLVVPARAQQWTGGLKVGGSVMNFTGNAASDFSARAGFAGGMALGYDFGTGFVLQPELLYVVKGAETDRDIVDTQGTVRTENIRWAISYADLSLLVMYRFQRSGTWHPKVYAGPMVARQLNATAKARLEGSNQSQSETDDSIQGSDYGAFVGAGVEMEMGDQRLSFEVRGVFGLANVREVEPALHNTGVLFLAGLIF